jgi:hypothetical protein
MFYCLLLTFLSISFLRLGLAASLPRPSPTITNPAGRSCRENEMTDIHWLLTTYEIDTAIPVRLGHLDRINRMDRIMANDRDQLWKIKP